jgi:hypothetical protein
MDSDIGSTVGFIFSTLLLQAKRKRRRTIGNLLIITVQRYLKVIVCGGSKRFQKHYK